MAPSIASGQDDLDLDGNWSVEPAPNLKKKKVKAIRGGLSGESVPQEEPARKARKRKARGEHEAASALDLAARADVAAPVAAGVGAGKRKRRGASRSAGAAADAGAAREHRGWAAGRLRAAWAAEGKALTLTPLEAGELVPSARWMPPGPAAAPLARLPWLLGDGGQAPEATESRALATLLAFRGAGAAVPRPRARSASVAVLSSSVERVFEVVAQLREAWPAKPFALSAHGGGRKKDQIARQARALAKGAVVVVATPGRLLRLLDEGHACLEGTELVVLDLAPDRKGRDLLTLPETRRDFFKLLRAHLQPLLERPEGPRLALCGSGDAADGG